jgi:hypothetical protein
MTPAESDNPDQSPTDVRSGADAAAVSGQRTASPSSTGPEHKSAEAQLSGCAPFVGALIAVVIDIVVSAAAGVCSIVDGCSAVRERSHDHAALAVAIVGALFVVAGIAALRRGRGALINALFLIGALLLISGLVIYAAASI